MAEQFVLVMPRDGTAMTAIRGRCVGSLILVDHGERIVLASVREFFDTENLTKCSAAEARNPSAAMHRWRQSNKRPIKDQIPHQRCSKVEI
jgi:hypothetical protein